MRQNKLLEFLLSATKYKKAILTEIQSVKVLCSAARSIFIQMMTKWTTEI